MKPWILGLLGTATLTFSCGEFLGRTSAATTNIMPQETLIVGTSADFPPFEFIETINGVEQIVGFDIDLANLIAKELNVSLTILDRSFPTLIDSLAANEFDFVIAALNTTPERLEIVDFSEPYYRETPAFVSRITDFVSDQTQLVDSTLGVQAGSSAIRIGTELQNTIEGLELVTFERQDEIIAAIVNNEIKAGLTVDVAAEFFVEANPSLDFSPAPSLGGFEAVIAFPQGSPNIEQFNTIIADFREEGVLEDLERKWFGTTSASVPEPSVIFGLITVGILSVVKKSPKNHL
ncbi:MAG: ABC transporter substrate-binding protein [Crocosphaera sp.]